MRVLGIDPGLTRCGVGVVDGSVGRALTMVHVGVFRTPADLDIARRLHQLEQQIEASILEHRPDVVAVERVFSQHNVRTVMGTAQASGIAMVVAARHGIPVQLHTPSEVKAAVTGSGRADKAQVTQMVTRLLRLTTAPTPGRRRGRPRAGDLPHLARRSADPAPGRRRGSVITRLRHGSPMIAHVRGPVAAVTLTSAVIDVGGVGMQVMCTPSTIASLRIGHEVQLSTSMVVREDSLTIFGFASTDERDMFELVQTASGVGPKVAQAMLAVLDPDRLRQAIGQSDLATLTSVPGIGRKGAERIVVELKDRVGVATIAATGAPGVARPGPRGAARARLVGA